MSPRAGVRPPSLPSRWPRCCASACPAMCGGILPRTTAGCLRAIMACRTPAARRPSLPVRSMRGATSSSLIPAAIGTVRPARARTATPGLRPRSLLLPIPYFHIVFTLPHALNPLVRQNPGPCYDLLFASASTTLLSFGEQELRAQLGVTMVLHTWSQTLLDHYHVHCIVTGGGLRTDGSMGPDAGPLALPGARPLGHVSRQVPRGTSGDYMTAGSRLSWAANGQAGPGGRFSGSHPQSHRKALGRLCEATLRRARRPSSPISPATPTASASPITASSPWTETPAPSPSPTATTRIIPGRKP